MNGIYGVDRMMRDAEDDSAMLDEIEAALDQVYGVEEMEYPFGLPEHDGEMYGDMNDEELDEAYWMYGDTLDDAVVHR